MTAQPDQQYETWRITNGMIKRTLPKAEWTHHAYLRAGLWHVLHVDAQSGFDLMRQRIRAYHVATGEENTKTGGHHETIIRFYLIMIRAYVNVRPGDTDPEELAVR